MSIPSAKVSSFASNPWLVAILLTLAALSLVGIRNAIRIEPLEFPLMSADNGEYILMAQGHVDQVMSPFSRRALVPFLGREISTVSGLSLQSAFILLNILTVFLLIYVLIRIFAIFKLSPWLTAIFILTPFSMDRIENGYMPDLFHAALVAIFFWLILRKQFLPGLLALAVAYMVRENTLVLCLVFGAMTFLKGLYRWTIGSGLIILAGTVFGSWCVRLGQPNASHLPDFLYLVLKLPHQFLKNVLGQRIWTNTLPFGEPIHIFTLPSFLRAGEVREVGICYPEWGIPLFTLVSLLTLFGAGPLIIWRTRRLKLWTEPHPFGIQIAFVYGLLSFFLGTSIGDWIDRLIGYGWPLFWICVPYILALMKRSHQDRMFRQSLGFIWAFAWIPPIFGYIHQSPLSVGLPTFLAVMAAYGFAWWRLGKNDLKLDPRQPVLD